MQLGASWGWHQKGAGSPTDGHKWRVYWGRSWQRVQVSVSKLCRLRWSPWFMAEPPADHASFVYFPFLSGPGFPFDIVTVVFLETDGSCALPADNAKSMVVVTHTNFTTFQRPEEESRKMCLHLGSIRRFSWKPGRKYDRPI